MIQKTDSNFEEVFNRINFVNLKEKMNLSQACDVLDALKTAKSEKRVSFDQLIALLSPAAEEYLEQMAQISSDLTLKYFGRTIMLYQPIYISNYCENHCLYCGFSSVNKVARKKLTLEEIEQESQAISKEGEVKHILLLTGEAPARAGLSYIKKAVEILKRYFSSVSIEVYPLDENEYSQLVKIGTDGLTVYQETYDKEVYQHLHVAGKKQDFFYRLGAAQRGAQAGLRTIGIGALYGLADCRLDAMMTGLHGRFLSDRYLDTEFSLSMPRLTPAAGDFQAKELMSDTLFVQVMLAFRLFLPRLGINVSTRESAEFRNNLLGLGVTRMSAGSRTSVGGYQNHNPSENQFSVGDDRCVKKVMEDLHLLGFQPVHKDWERFV